VLAAAVLLPYVALAHPTPGEEGQVEDTAAELQELLDALSHSTFDAAPEIADRIMRAWSDPGSDSLRLVFERAGRAYAAGNAEAALAHLQDLTELAPEFAEGWNLRATLYYNIGEYQLSLADIERVLALEPRHFGALSGQGLVRAALGETEQAAESFRRALAVHPHLPVARGFVESRAPASGG